MSGSNSSVPDVRAPAEPLGLTVHNLPEAGLAGDVPGIAAAQPQQVRRGRLKMLLVLLVCASPVIASYFSYYVVRPSGGSTAYGQLIQPSVSLPEAEARSISGQPVAMRSLKGQWLLVVVGGGACPQACTDRLFLQRQLREMTGRERDRVEKVWLITDEAPPPPALLAALEASPAMRVLRLPEATVAAWLRPAEGQPLDAHLYIVDPMGEWMMRAPVSPDPAKLKRDLDRLLRASASWDTAGR